MSYMSYPLQCPACQGILLDLCSERPLKYPPPKPQKSFFGFAQTDLTLARRLDQWRHTYVCLACSRSFVHYEVDEQPIIRDDPPQPSFMMTSIARNTTLSLIALCGGVLMLGSIFLDHPAPRHMHRAVTQVVSAS